MIEAANKILKYRHLFRKPIPNVSSAISAIHDAITDYNNRPRYELKGLSPNQAHNGEVFDTANYKLRLAEARKQRILQNRNEPHPCLRWNTFLQKGHESLLEGEITE